MLHKNIDFFNIRKQYGDIFWLKLERHKFNKEHRYKDMDFDEFILIMDDYYLLNYASKLNRNSWLLFSWIRFLTRSNGFACLSYNEIMNIFCENGTKISKPTFFNCIDELIKQNLILKIPTYKICSGNEKYLKDSNAYAIVSKSSIIYEICDMMQTKHCSSLEAFNIMNSEVVKLSKGKVRSKINSSNKYKLLRLKFRPIIKLLDDFFEFLGSYNKSGKVAISRKVKILEMLKEYIDGDFTFDDLSYAINVTMRNTAKGGNIKKERYMFKILEAQVDHSEDEKSENVVADKLSKKAEKTLEVKGNNKLSKGIDETKYKEEVKRLLTVEGYCKTIIGTYKTVNNEFEDKLVKSAKIIQGKFNLYKNNSSYLANRIKVLSKYGISENSVYDKKWNRHIEWFDENDKPVSLDKIKKILKENNSEFKITKYDII
jgi:hypothetical protein